MTRKNWLLFVLAGFLWGIPYLFLRIAVREFEPGWIVFARLVIGAAILIPISVKQGTLAAAMKGWKFVLLYAITEMVFPWYLITKAETEISSGLTALLIASVPIWSTIFASLHGDKTVWHHKRLVGMLIGFLGVFLLVGIESLSGHSALWAIIFVLVASVGYGYAVNMITQKLPNVSGVAVNAVGMGMAALIYTPFGILQWPRHHISASAIFAIVVLGVLCTAAAFIVFFAVMDEIGAARASLVTYLNTAFAVVLGVLILSEPLTLGIAVGLPLVLLGSYLASRKTKTS